MMCDAAPNRVPLIRPIRRCAGIHRGDQRNTAIKRKEVRVTEMLPFDTYGRVSGQCDERSDRWMGHGVIETETTTDAMPRPD